MNKFLVKLKAVCKKCSKQTILVYARNVKRLYQLNNDGEEIPLNTNWINSEDLIKKYKAQPLKVRRHLSVSAVKYFQAVGKEPKDWYKFMMEDNIILFLRAFATLLLYAPDVFPYLSPVV